MIQIIINIALKNNNDTEIDTHGDNTHSVLETIITEHRSSFVLNPVIYEILLEKWNSYGHKVFVVWFILHILY